MSRRTAKRQRFYAWRKRKVACEYASGQFDHEWEFQDESFDHEFGTQQVHYWMCACCGLIRDVEPGDFDDDDHYSESDLDYPYDHAY